MGKGYLHEKPESDYLLLSIDNNYLLNELNNSNRDLNHSLLGVLRTDIHEFNNTNNDYKKFSPYAASCICGCFHVIKYDETNNHHCILSYKEQDSINTDDSSLVHRMILRNFI